MKSILVPVDFSEIAENASRYALRLAAVFEAEVTLLYGIPPGPNHASPFVITPYAELKEAAKRKMHLFQHKCLTSLKNELSPLLKVSTSIEYGDLDNVVGTLVEQKSVDLIVMGTKGKSNAWRSAFGSNATYLLNAAPCPVLVVPAVATYQRIQNVCIGVDESKNGLQQLEAYFKLLSPFSPSVHLIKVLQKEEGLTDFVETSMEALRAYPKLMTRTTIATIVNPSIVSGLLDYAKTNSCELVVMNRPSKGWLERIFSASNTRQAVLESEIPILITRPDQLS